MYAAVKVMDTWYVAESDEYSSSKYYITPNSLRSTDGEVVENAVRLLNEEYLARYR